MKTPKKAGNFFLIFFIFLHVALFSLGYSMMGFSIPLYAYFRGANQLSLGLIGLLWMTPNIVVPFFLTKVNSVKKIQRVLILTIISIIPVSFFTPFLSDLKQIMGMVVLFGVLQAFWWTGIEIYLGIIYSGRQKVMAYFSLVWGISFLIAPTLSGYILDNIGFLTNYFLVSAIFVVALILYLIQKSEGANYSSSDMDALKESEDPKNDKINYLVFIPSFTAGIIIATISSVFPGYLRSNNISDFAIGELFAAYAFSRIFGFFFMTAVTKKIDIKVFFIVGLLLQLFIIVPFFSISYVPLVLMMAIVGLGSGYAFSTPLIYVVSKQVKPLAKNVAIYEISLGVSSAATSLFSGVLGEDVSINFPYFASFVLIFIFLIIILLNYKRL